MARMFIVEGRAYTEAEMLAANDEAPDVCAWVKAARPGDKYQEGLLDCQCVDGELFRTAADDAIMAYGGQVIGRMVADGATDTSDAEIQRTLAGCVCGPMLVALAMEMRRRGLLVLERSMALRDVLAPHWVALIAKHEACVVTTPGGPDLLNWAATEPCSLDIIKTTAYADSFCAQWPEQADSLREIACQRIGMLAWG